MINPSFDTFNAKKLTPREIASSFVVPSAFTAIAGADHCYIIGPRGSGKTTLLRMLYGESLMAWRGTDAEQVKSRINYSSIFLPADELWASQTSAQNAKAAFTAQMLYAFVETMMYRTTVLDESDSAVHLPVQMTHDQQVNLIRQCAESWGLTPVNHSFLGLQEALDGYLLKLSDGPVDSTGLLGSRDGLGMLGAGVRAFNRAAGEPHRKWALLLDEMELAPPEIHQAVISFVRGGSSDLILKVSMSPFDRYMHAYGAGGGPIPGHDFQTVYLSGQSRAEIHKFTSGLWRESLRSRLLPAVPISTALGATSILNVSSATSNDSAVLRVLQSANERDDGFSDWLRQRNIDLASLSNLSYNQRSATIRKVFPLLIFRDAILTFRDGRPVRRSRKKSLEPFTGATAVTTMLEGNPRWIKSAFSQMLNYYDSRSKTISPGFQFDALVDLANRFESLLRVLPRRDQPGRSVLVTDLVDGIAAYLNRQNTSTFSPEPQNCFTVDNKTPPEVIDALVMGLYAGAFVHVRDRRSPAVLSDFRGQRFRLAYLLAIRDEKEFPLRLGNAVKLSTILKTMPMRVHSVRAGDDVVELDLGLN